jgi:tetratricopeptide (TPR) repeat protein
MFLQDKGRHEEALEEYNRAIELDPENPKFRYQVASLLIKMRRTNDAVAELDAAIAVRPTESAYYFLKAQALKRTRKYDLAMGEIDKAIQFNPNVAEYHFEKAMLWRDIDHVDDAIAEFDAAIKLQPDGVDYYEEKAALLRETGRLSEALSTMKSLTERVTGNPEIWLHYAEVVALKESSKAAIDELAASVKAKHVTTKQLCEVMKTEKKKDMELSVKEMIEGFTDKYC